jgi:hypothetical protein
MNSPSQSCAERSWNKIVLFKLHSVFVSQSSVKSLYNFIEDFNMNAWQQVDQIASEALQILEDSLIITNLTTRDKTADFNRTASGYAVGDSVRIKTRPDYTVNEFTSTISTQGIRESVRDMTIEKHFDISVSLTAKEKALDFESLIEQVIRPAVYRLAEKCDTYVGTKILQARGLYSSAALFTDQADMALARKAANIQQLEPGGRYMLLNSDLEAILLGKSFFTQYNNRGDEGVTSFRDAALGKAMGMTFYPSLQFPELTFAAGNGVAQTNNASGVNNRVGASILTIDSVDLSTTTIKAGDRVKVAGMRRPLKVSTLANGASTTQLLLTDPIDEIVPDNAAVTVVSSGATYTIQGAILDSQSLAVAMPVLDKPSDKPSFVVNSNGFSIRVVQGYDMTTKTETMSLDCLIGAAAYDARRITLLGDNA